VWTGLFLGAGLALIPGLVLIGLALPRTPRDTPTAPLAAV
jgi:ABC-type transporter Mla subunit MlaD